MQKLSTEVKEVLHLALHYKRQEILYIDTLNKWLKKRFIWWENPQESWRIGIIFICANASIIYAIIGVYCNKRKKATRHKRGTKETRDSARGIKEKNMLTAHNEIIQQPKKAQYTIIDNLEKEQEANATTSTQHQEAYNAEVAQIKAQIQGHTNKGASLYKIIFFERPQEVFCAFVSVAMAELELHNIEQAQEIARAVFIETGLTHATIKVDSNKYYIRLDKLRGIVQGW